MADDLSQKGGALMNGVNALSPPSEDTEKNKKKQNLSMNQKRVLIRCQTCQYLDLGLLRVQNYCLRHPICSISAAEA